MAGRIEFFPISLFPFPFSNFRLPPPVPVRSTLYLEPVDRLPARSLP
jgi:hypothetical protein